MQIWILEDDEQILEMTTYALTGAGFQVSGFRNAYALYQQLNVSTPSLLLLDLMLPDEDGLSVLKHLRADPKTTDLRVIIVSARSSELDKVRGLDFGADDYIAKPFGVMELISRVKAQLRRIEPSGGSDMTVLHCGGISLDTTARTVMVEESEISLTYKEFELLCLLMEHPGQVLSRGILMERIWGYDFEGTSRTLDMHIRTLRQKLGDYGRQIQTVRNVGYKIEEAK